MLPWWLVLLIFAAGIAIPVMLFLIYCTTADSKRKSSIIVNAILRYLIYGIIIVACLWGLLSALRSCALEDYDRGYEAGYKAGLEAGIEMVQENPGEYFD